MRPAREIPEAVASALVDGYLSGQTMAQIAEPFGLGQYVVRRVLTERGVEIRGSTGHRGRPRPLKASLDEIVRMHSEGLSCNQIAKHFDTYQWKVAKFLRKAGHEPNDGRFRRGSANPITKVGKWTTKEGYVTAILDLHEYHLRGRRKGNSMLEHRLVMARHLGRPLYDYENVHHMNGDKADNRLENLELWEMGQPPGQRKNEAPPRKHCPTCTCC